jgi:hypothetical protein
MIVIRLLFRFLSSFRAALPHGGFLACVVLGFVALIAPSARSADDGFRPLVRGDDPAQFEIVGLERDQIAIAAGEIRLSGKAKGYLATKESYKNYALAFEWQYDVPENKRPTTLNSGLLLHAQAAETHNPGSRWPRGIEVQLWYKNYNSFYTLSGAQFAPKADDLLARDKALRQPGEWNRQEIFCRDGEITASLNGTAYASGARSQPDSGRIGLMYEGSSIRFRGLKIKVEK